MRFNKGFTLLELLLAMSLSTLVILTLALALRFSLGMWWKGIGSQEEEIDFFKITHLLEKQLKYISTFRIFHTHGLFIGEEDNFCFVTNYSLLTANKAAPVLVKYELENGKIFYREIPFTYADKIETSLKALDNTKPIELKIPLTWHCVYYEGGGAKNNWPKEKNNLPEAIEIKANLKGKIYKFLFPLR